MLRYIFLEVKKNCAGPYVLFSVAFIVALGFGSSIYDSSGEQMTLFVLARKIYAGDIAGEISYSAPFIWKQGLGSWLTLFAPLLVSIGYVVGFSEERQNGQVRFELIRAGNLRYSVAKVAGGGLSSGFVFALGYALFGLLVWSVFPRLSVFELQEQEVYMEMYFQSSMMVFVCRQLVGVFLFGVLAGVFGVGVTVVFEDRYMLMCLPFLLNYMYQQVLQKIAAEMYARGAESAAWVEAFYPSSIVQLDASRYWMVPFAVLVLTYLGIVGVLYTRMRYDTLVGHL